MTMRYRHRKPELDCTGCLAPCCKELRIPDGHDQRVAQVDVPGKPCRGQP